MTEQVIVGFSIGSMIIFGIIGLVRSIPSYEKTQKDVHTKRYNRRKAKEAGYTRDSQVWHDYRIGKIDLPTAQQWIERLR